MKPGWIGLFLLAGFLASLRAEAPLTLRGAVLGNWWALGQDVVFQPGDAAAWAGAAGTELVGQVSDSEGAPVAEVKAPLPAFLSGGWHWRPAAAGFYSVRFQLADAAGHRKDLAETFATRSGKLDGEGRSLKTESFSTERAVHDVVVTRAPVRPPPEIPPLFGVCMDMRTAHPPQLAAEIGFRFVRLHPTPWWTIEQQEGKYDWTLPDAMIADLQGAGFRDFVGNPFGTPAWASTADDKLKEQLLYKNRYTAYMPKSLDSWTAFLDALVRRYPMVKTWELWNEANFPGQSIFWMGSPDEFVALLKAGYAQVKKSAPGTEVWFGGIGMDYLPFYQRAIQLGAGPAFDVLALHGRGDTAEPFDEAGRRFQVAPKPWVNSEWHALLMKSGDPQYPTDRELASRLVFDFLRQVKAGARRLTLFALLNHEDGQEREALARLKEQGALRTSVSGLFRSTPYQEPRFPACVLRNLIDGFSGEIRFRAAYAFGAQAGALLESDAGPVLILWNPGAAEAPLNPALQKAMAPDSLLVDWEGKAVPPSAPLKPGRFYFLRKPSLDGLAGWKAASDDLLDDAARPVLAEGAWAVPGRGDGWIEAGDYVALGAEPKPEGFAARFRPALGSGGLDLVVEVDDAAHRQTFAGNELYKGDSVQFALDARGMGRGGDRLEFIAAQTPAGPVLWKGAAPSLGGDIPVRYAYPNNPVESGTVAVETTEKGLRYRIHVDPSDLYPFAPDAAKIARFSLLVNDDDGKGRAGFLRWGGGIGEGKDVREYGTLVPQANLLATALKAPKGVAADGGVLRLAVTADNLDGARLAAPAFAVKPGEKIVVAFQWRGSVLPQAFVLESGPDVKGRRVDVVKRTNLDPKEWRDVRIVLKAAPDVSRLQLTILSWKQDGFYEVRDFHAYRESSEPAP